MIWEWIVGILVSALWCYGIWKLSEWMDRKERTDR